MNGSEPGMHRFIIPSPRGHDEIQWNPNDPGHVAAAKERFQKEKLRGMTFYRKDAEGKDEIVREFDPKDATLVVLAPMVGG